MRSTILMAFSLLISLNAQAGFLLQCDKACQACPYFCYCSEAEQKFSCSKEPAPFETDEQTVESSHLIAGADPCSLCAKDPKKWPGACEMCYGSARNSEDTAIDSSYGAICCSDACQGATNYYACYDRCVKSPMGLGC